MKHGESQLQRNCVKWFRLQYPELSLLLFAVPNGSKRDAITASILKAEGVVSGVSDLILLVPNADYHALCIEMKFGTNNPTDNQKSWGKAAEKYGNKYAVVRSFEQFRQAVNDYLYFG